MAGEQRIKLSMETAKAKKDLTELIQLTQKTAQKFEDVNNQLKDRGSLEGYVKTLAKNLESTNKKITETTKKLETLKKKRDEALKDFNDKNAPKVSELNASSEKSKKKIELAKEEIEQSKYDLQYGTSAEKKSAGKRIENLQGIINTEAQNIDSNNAEIAKLKSQAEEILNDEKIKKLEEELVQLHAKKDQIIDETDQKYDAETEALIKQRDELQQNLNMLGGGITEQTKTVQNLESPFSKIKANLKDIASKSVEMGKSLMNNVGNGLSKVWKSLGSLKDKVGGLFKKNATSGLQNGMSSILGTTKKFGMALLGAYSAYSLITRAVNQIKEDNKELANTMSTLWNGLVSLITPVVNALVNAFATALNYILKIASVISGINILGKLKQANKKANAKSGGSGSSNSNKLYSFDTSETLQKNSGGSGSSVVDEGLLKEVELNDKLKGYAEKLKKIWDNIKGIGANLLDRIKEGLEYMNSGQRIMAVLDKLANAFLDDWIEITDATLEWSKNINFGPLFDSLATVLESLEPILEKIGDLFVWLWINCVLPLATYLIERLIPAINNTLAPALDIINQVLDVLGKTLLKLWNDTLKPLFETIGNDLIDDLNKIREFLENIRDSNSAVETFTTIFEGFADVIRSLAPYVSEVGDLLEWLVTEIIVPLCDWLLTTLIPALNTFTSMLLDFLLMVLQPLKELLLLLWETLIQPIAEFLAGIFVDALNIVNEVITENKDSFQKLFDVLSELFIYIKESVAPHIKELLNNLRELFNTVMDGIFSKFSDTIDGVTLALKGVITFLTGVFAGDWKKAWAGLKDIFGGIWNAVLGIVESVLNGMVNGINWIVDKLNVLSVDLPDFMGGGSFGINLGHVSPVDLSAFKYVPGLAQGAVIPPNREFLAMLGDQTRGKNIEAPEELIREIVSEESGTQEINIVANGTMSQLIKLLRLELQKEDKRVGSSLVVGG